MNVDYTSACSSMYTRILYVCVHRWHDLARENEPSMAYTYIFVTSLHHYLVNDLLSVQNSFFTINE